MENSDNKKTLASELLHEVKATSHRWFIAFIIMLILWFATIIAFIVYLSLPIEANNTSINQNSTNQSINSIVGGDDNVSDTDSDYQSYDTEK